MTDPAGDFNIQGLPPGTYTVEEVLQAGWTQTTPVSPDFFTVTVTAGNTVSGLLFGNFQNITISGEKFNDLDGNGVQDAGRSRPAGLDHRSARRVGSHRRHHGHRRQRQLQLHRRRPRHLHGAGRAAVRLDPDLPGPSGHLHGRGHQRRRPDGPALRQLPARDLRGHGLQRPQWRRRASTPGDPGLQGWTVNLLDSSGNLRRHARPAPPTARTASPNLGPGLYTIEEVNQTGWYQTEPVNPPGTYTEQAISGGDFSGLDFGNFQLVNVTGEVYNDLNGNGNLDPGEPGLQGWTVHPARFRRQHGGHHHQRLWR